MVDGLVSIVTPLYNSERFLMETFLSVAGQSYQNWEMIIVDDCSSDGSLGLARSICKMDRRVRLICSESNGAAAARNMAIKAAQGRYIAFLDSDDVWLPNKLERQVGFMREHGVAFSFTAYEKIDEHGRVFGCMGVPNKVGYKDLLKTCSIGCLTAVYDTEKLGKVYMPENTKREDYATWLSILKEGEFAYGVNEVFARYRVYSDQSSAKKIKMAKENWRLYRNVEGLGLRDSICCFLHYAIRGILRSRTPRLARILRVLN